MRNIMNRQVEQSHIRYDLAEIPADVQIDRICEALESQYGSPRHGNKKNPLNELIYIVISNRTQPAAVRSVYSDLKRRFPSWSSVRATSAREIERILKPAGLSWKKSVQIVEIVARLKRDFGRATLSPLRAWSDEKCEEFLSSLPGVSAKVAKCVLMYSFGRDVLPVDVHVHRVATRLGFKTKKRPDTSHELIEAAVPPKLRYSVHVNFLAHGRAICRSRVPLCRECCIRMQCANFEGKRR
jgi:endonuclease III